MAEKVFLVHGWSVSETTTYRGLHHKLAQSGFDLHEIYLGRYVSLDNEVEIRDVSRAMHNELLTNKCLGRGTWSQPFHIVTHSTGALVVKHWILHHYAGRSVQRKALKNVVFLAGPHFGSRLAHHGRSMLAHAKYGGDTGKKILTSLELGSAFSWENNGAWLDRSHWKAKGIRPYCLIGDRVERSFFKSKIFPAGYEAGSDMVVRAAAGNLNFRRYELNLVTRRMRKVGEIAGVPFGAFAEFTHSGPEMGIMNSITPTTNQQQHAALRRIVQCLKVKRADEYARTGKQLADVTRQTRKKRQAFAQLDFRFRDVDGAPIDDYSFVLGAVVDGQKRPSKTIAHNHKNGANPSHFTVFINLKHFEPHLVYYMELTASTDTPLVDLKGFTPKFAGEKLTDVITADRSTQIDVIVGREPRRELFVFHRGDDPDLHVRWDRSGEIVKRGL